jgi:hypothetical protein
MLIDSCFLFFFSFLSFFFFFFFFFSVDVTTKKLTAIRTNRIRQHKSIQVAKSHNHEWEALAAAAAAEAADQVRVVREDRVDAADLVQVVASIPTFQWRAGEDVRARTALLSGVRPLSLRWR